MGTLSRVHIYNYAKTRGRNEDCLGRFWNIWLVYWARPCSQRLLVSEFQYMAVGLWAMDLTFLGLSVLIWKLETVRGLTKKADWRGDVKDALPVENLEQHLADSRHSKKCHYYICRRHLAIRCLPSPVSCILVYQQSRAFASQWDEACPRML